MAGSPDRRSTRSARSSDRPDRNSVRAAVLLVAGAAVLVRVPAMGHPLSPDEAGFLMVAAQWHAGDSLYGDYWVDRPPVLIGLFWLANVLGGQFGLRALGLVAVATSVVLASQVGAQIAPRVRWAPVLTAGTAAAFLVSAQFGARMVNGELLAVPFVLAGVVACLHALARGRTLWWGAAGASAMAAALVKQSLADVFVLAGFLGLWLVLRGRPQAAVRAAGGFVLGALAMLIGALALSAVHGTGPLDLFHAVVTFRIEAGEVISAEALDNTTARGWRLALGFVTSGAVLLVVLGLFIGRRRDGAPAAVPDPRLLAVVLLAWELTAVALGGSYWRHYLIGTVPGLVVATAAALALRPARTRLVALVVAYAAVLGIGNTVIRLVDPLEPPSGAPAAEYLRENARPGDTATVAFGNPAILHSAGLDSPYPDLWSLPVRVRDPDLERFGALLASPERPDWIVVRGAGLATWGVDASSASPLLYRDYALAFRGRDFLVLRAKR